MILAALALISAQGSRAQQRRCEVDSALELGETSANSPEFEVSTVKPSPQNAGSRIEFTLDGLSARGATVRELLENALGVSELGSITGLPAWAYQERFDIDAKTNSVSAKDLRELSLVQRRAMLQRLLAERFNLSAHHECRVRSVYLLSIALKGPKLRQSKVEPAPATEIKGYDNGTVRGGIGALEVEHVSMPTLAELLSQKLGQSVIDQTHLLGRYDVSLHWSPEALAMPRIGEAESSGPPVDTSWPPIIAAVKEELGLKLERGQAPVDTVVIDRIEQPSDN
jgi:uncharacterized protein (TIGR03435 family)